MPLYNSCCILIFKNSLLMHTLKQLYISCDHENMDEQGTRELSIYCKKYYFFLNNIIVYGNKNISFYFTCGLSTRIYYYNNNNNNNNNHLY